MARITVEDCNKYVDNRFELILIAAQRGKQLNRGAAPSIEKTSHKKEALIALKEIAAGSLKIEELERSIIYNDSEDGISSTSADLNRINQQKQVDNSISESISE